MQRFLLLTGLLGILATQYLIFFYAPVESTLGISQKIFYIHLPLAWWGLISFFGVFLCSVLFLWKRNGFILHIALACGEIGELLCVLTVLTGIIWGKMAWGVWWTWDPRLTTALVLCFLYGGWLILRRMEWSEQRKGIILAVTGILSFLDVPLVFVSARMWRSIHPAVFTTKGAAMTEEMLVTTLIAIAAFGLFFLGLLLFRIRQLSLAAKIQFSEAIIRA